MDIEPENIKNYWSLSDDEKASVIATDNFNRLHAEYQEICKKWLEKQRKKWQKQEKEKEKRHETGN